MKKIYSKAATLFITTNAWANGDLPKVPSMVYQPKESGRLAEAAAFKSTTTTIAAERQVPAYEPDSATPADGPKKTGVVHTLAEPVQLDRLKWEQLADGGYAVKVKVHADRAKRLRLHLHIAGNYAAIQIRLKGNAPASQIDLVTAHVFPNGNLWLPVTDGDEVILELYTPSLAAREAMASAVLDQVNYQYASAEGGQFAALGRAVYPEYDVTCWSKDPAYSVLLKGAAATAKINYVSSTGGSYMCTGTLLADRGNTGTPWFTTANHCIGDQYEADSLNAEWFYQATACGSVSTDSRYQKTYGGAQLIWTNYYYDASFLKLNSNPPSGVIYAGWDSNTPSTGLKVWGIHHPKGDHTMASVGNVVATNVPALIDGGDRELHEMQYTYGGTEPGSSGSGFFSTDGTSLFWRGTLSGGPSYNYQISLYSPFSSYYNNIKSYIYPNTATPTPSPTPSPTPTPTPTPTPSPTPTTTQFTVTGSLSGAGLGSDSLSLGMSGENCTVNGSTYTCTIPTTSTSTTCGPLIPAIVRKRKSSNSKASPQIVDNFAASPTSFTPTSGGKIGSACNGQTFNQAIAITKKGLSFDEQAAKLLDCAETIASSAFPPGSGYAQYDSMVGSSVAGAASVERTYTATNWGSAVVRLSATDTTSNFYYYRAPGSGWASLGDLESINSLYCHAW